MKYMVLKSIIDGILRGIIIWCTTILLTSEAISSDLLKVALFVITGIVLSCISMTYIYYINKDSLFNLIISFCISMLWGVISFIFTSIYMSRPFWNFISKLLALDEIGTVGGVLIIYYQAAFITLTEILRALFIIINITKKFFRRIR